MSAKAGESSSTARTIEQLHRALSDYIEAEYHIGDERLIRQRKRLLYKIGVIHQEPYLESTPRYKAQERFAEIAGLDKAALEVFRIGSTAASDQKLLIHDPPYGHQAESIKESLVSGRSLVVMTGTGSGKTECFLLPILGKLAIEARHKPQSFKSYNAVRALVLYPMNALVNDQLGRLRLLFGDKRIVDWFTKSSGRPARFARYTSRTLYPGVRTAKKDQLRLKPIGDYYVGKLNEAAGSPSPEQQAAKFLVDKLRERGKFPAKPDLVKWYGRRGGTWQDTTGAFKRCVTLPEDPELLTRHEVHEAPPDILVTNYSMLEYMLMRPLERPVFDSTRAWLEANTDERLLLVIDEAHLYRGAAGAEVALLIRRLRARLGIPAERLQVICTSASFKDGEAARMFGAQLSGKLDADFVTVQGELQVREPEAQGNREDAECLAALSLSNLYDAATTQEQLDEVGSFLDYRDVKERVITNTALYEALKEFPPMNLLVNLTMQQAVPVRELGGRIFEGVESTRAERAVTTLMALGSLARRDPTEPGLLPCRIHSFYRGLPGLWACLDPDCAGLGDDERGGPTGKLYSQPRESCDYCRARVFELYTCRNCGTAYARSYTDKVRDPDFLWTEPGGAFRTSEGEDVEEFEPLDLLLEEPTERSEVEPVDLDLMTGRLKMYRLGQRIRTVYLKKNRTHDSSEEDTARPFGAATKMSNAPRPSSGMMCFGKYFMRRRAMERFMKRHESRVAGIITGFDRVLFRGNLSSICHLGGMDRLLSSLRVLYKDFGKFALKISDLVKDHAQEIAEQQGRPFLYLRSSKESKEDAARAIMERDRITEGLICIFSCVEPCQSFTIRREASSKHIHLAVGERKCLHLYFYFVDREFGIMHVRLQTWLPLTIQVCINGREWLAREMDMAGIKYQKVDNCFPWIADIGRAQELMDKLSNRKWAGFLNALARRVNPWLNPKGEIVLRPYYWTMRQSEYATDILFKDQKSLEEIYPALIRYAIEELGTEDILRFLSRAKRSHFQGEVRTSLQRRGEGLRIRHWVRENSVKMYNKAGNILRIETTINNPKRFKVRRRSKMNGKEVVRWMDMRKGIADVCRRVEVSRAANERYLEALAVVGEPTPSHKLLDAVSKRIVGPNKTMYRALRPISPDESYLFQAVLKGEHHIQGIRNQDIRKSLYPDSENDKDTRRKRSARSTRLLRLLQAHQLVYRVPTTNYYRVTKKGHDIMGTALRFRETDLALLAA